MPQVSRKPSQKMSRSVCRSRFFLCGTLLFRLLLPWCSGWGRGSGLGAWQILLASSAHHPGPQVALTSLSARERASPGPWGETSPLSASLLQVALPAPECPALPKDRERGSMHCIQHRHCCRSGHSWGGVPSRRCWGCPLHTGSRGPPAVLAAALSPQPVTIQVSFPFLLSAPCCGGGEALQRGPPWLTTPAVL